MVLLKLWQVYNLFRQLGLRHICVVPQPSEVVGIITRKDLWPEVRHPYPFRSPRHVHLEVMNGSEIPRSVIWNLSDWFWFLIQ